MPQSALVTLPGEGGTVGPYRIVKELGKGGMGAVFLALDTRLDREVALKVLLPAFAADPLAKERFLREAKAVAKVSHDHVVTVHEADERDGVPYIAMQFLKGYPLDEFLKKKGAPSLPHCVRIVREAALGLAAAHRRGLVHRDIKPANLWLEAPNGRVKVLDFGLAKPVGSDSELTKSGAVVGTPAYMSPEQASGQKVDHRTDIFSLGTLLYRLLTGRTPFNGEHIMAVLTALAVEEPTPVRELNPKVPAALADLVHQMLAKKPEARPQTATEVAERLRAALSQAPEGASDSVPVVLEPTAAPATMQVSAIRNVGTAPSGDGERDDTTEREAEPHRDGAGAPKRKKRGLIAGGVLALVAVSVAVALGTGKKLGDTAKNQDPPLVPLAKNDTRTPILTLKGHTGSVFAASFSADGTQIVTGSADGTAKVWDAKTGKEVLALEGHSDSVLVASFSADGTRVVTGSADKTAKVWDAKTGAEVLSLKGHSFAIYSASFSSDGTRLITSEMYDRTATVWDAKTGAKVFSLKGQTNAVTTASFSPDGNRIVTGNADGAAKVWNAKTGAELLSLKGLLDDLRAVSFSADGTQIVTAGGDTAEVWDAITGSMRRALGRHGGRVRAASYSPDGTRIVTGSDDKTAKVWDVKTGAEVFTLQGHTHAVNAASFSPDGKRIVTGSADGTAKVWDAK